MKRMWKLMFASVLTLGFSQVSFATESENAAKKIVKEAANGNYSKFQKRLVGGRGTKAARDIYEIVRSRATDYKELKAREALVDSGYGFRIYNVDVYGENPRTGGLPESQYLVTATVQCAVGHQYSMGYCYGRGPRWGHGWGWSYGSWCQPGYSFETEKCAVTTLHTAE
jgi:hypothetical protein